MTREGSHALGDEFERFEEALRHFAMEIVRDVLQRELARKQAAAPKAQRAKRARPEPAKRARRGRSRRRKVAPQLELSLAAAAAQASSHAADVGAAVDHTPAPEAGDLQGDPGGVPPGGASEARPDAALASLSSGKRRKWTRETVVEELATWMVNGTALDAQYLTRHGPPGLVAAARRIFGRFDAALNVAGLHFAKLYPDGPPVRRRGPGGALPAAAPRPDDRPV